MEERKLGADFRFRRCTERFGEPVLRLAHLLRAHKVFILNFNALRKMKRLFDTSTLCRRRARWHVQPETGQRLRQPRIRFEAGSKPH